MNMRILFLLLIILGANYVSAQKSYRALVHEGNKKFNTKNYEGSSSRYMEAIKLNDKDFTAHYNLGNALYKSKKYEEAKAEFEKAKNLAKNKEDKAAALHNLGNASMQTNNPEKAADYYKQSLKHDPYSEATRKNYEIAKLKEKQNQQQQNQDEKSGEGGKGKDQNQNQSNQDQQGNSKDKNQENGSGQINNGEDPNGKTSEQNKNNNEGKNKIPTTFAGLPITIAYGGILFLTTEPAPTLALLPIVTPEHKVTFAPNQTSSSTIMSFSISFFATTLLFTLNCSPIALS